MTGSFRLARPACSSLFKQIFHKNIASTNYFGCPTRRDIYTDEAIKIPSFKTDRRKACEALSASEIEQFFEDSRKTLSREGPGGMMHVKWLLKAISLTTTDEHLQLLKDMTERHLKYSGGNHNFGNFHLGPQLLRLNFVLDQPEVGLKMLDDPSIGKLFSDITSFMVLMTHLYNAGMYEEVFAVMEKVRGGRYIPTRYPRPCVVITLAAALKLDTPSHLERALSLAEEAGSHMKAGIMMKKIQLLAGAIALKLERGHQALALLNNTPWDKNDAICDILVRARLLNGELEQVMSLLRPLAYAELYSPSLKSNRHLVYRRTFEDIRAAVKASRDIKLEQEWLPVERAILDRDLLCDEDVMVKILEPMDNIDLRDGSKYARKAETGSEIRIRETFSMNLPNRSTMQRNHGTHQNFSRFTSMKEGRFPFDD